jgi:subtilisin-like proprotein convertase family protein
LRSVSSAKLELCMHHTSPTDLEWSITPPNSTNGLVLPLPTQLGRSCDSGQGQLHSLHLLSTIGSDPITQGRWTLKVKDRVLGHTGSLIQWRVVFEGLQ